MATTTPNYDVNLEDERFQTVETERQNELTNVENTYDEMIEQSDGFYNAQVEASKEWAQQQQDILDQQTDFTIEQINQQKEQAEKDYKKEQSGAYTDWQKQSNAYGVNAEQMAASGLTNTGYAESSKVGMYNTYQNRVTATREGFRQATQNFDNAINEARLENNAAKAEIAMQAYLQQTEILMQGFQYKNELMDQLQSQLQAINQRYDTKWKDVYDRIMQENALLYQAERDRIADEQWKAEFDLLQEQSGYLEDGGTVQEDETEQLQLDAPGVPKGAPYADNQPAKEPSGVINPLGLGSSSNLMEIKNHFNNKTIDGQKASQSGLNTSILPSGEGWSKSEGIWNVNGKYMAWNDIAGDYIDVTELITFSNGYQPKYIDNTELKSVGTIGGTIGSHGDLPQKQNVWMAGNKYYVWNGKTREYEDVTSKYKEYLDKVEKRNKWIENFAHVTYT